MDQQKFRKMLRDDKIPSRINEAKFKRELAENDALEKSLMDLAIQGNEVPPVIMEYAENTDFAEHAKNIWFYPFKKGV